MTTNLTHLIIGSGQLGETIGVMFPEADLFDLNDAPDAKIGVGATGAETGVTLGALGLQVWYDIIHICFPYSSKFVRYVLGYIKQFRPAACIIHGTVLPGTTRLIQDAGCNCYVSYSPCRGRHGKDGEMERDFREFTKYVGAVRTEFAVYAANVLAEHGFTVKVMDNPEVLELGKIFQTTMTGVLIMVAQEYERYCEEFGVDYYKAMEMCEMPNTPKVVHRPDHIGGHCVIQNLKFLDTIRPEGIIPPMIRVSNEDKEVEQCAPYVRVYPIPYRQNR